MLQLRRLAPALARNGGSLRQLGSSPALLKDKKDDKKAEEEGFELLPPGCSMMDPAYAVGGAEEDNTVYYYDQAGTRTPAKRGQKPVPQTPTSLAAAQEKLKQQQKSKAAEEEPYMYLPPGSSMREPGYHSMSDPGTGGRVYYRDPTPVLRRK